MKIVKFRYYLKDKNIGTLIDRLVTQDTVKFYIVKSDDGGNIFYSTLGQEMKFTSVIDWCCTKIENIMSSGEFNDSQLLKMLNYLNQLEDFKLNMVNKGICPVCGGNLKVDMQKRSKVDDFGITTYEDVAIVDCNNCKYMRN